MGVKKQYGLALDGDRVSVACTGSRKRDRETQVLWDGRIEKDEDSFHALAQSIHAEVQAGIAVLAASMPVSSTVTRWLEAPFASVSKARKILPSLLDIQLPFSIESCVYGFPLVQGTGSTVRALAVAARRDAVEARIAACRKLGLDPVSLDHEGITLWKRGMARLPVEENTRRVIAHMGQEETILVLGQGERFENAHGIRTGMTAMEKSDSGSTNAFVDRTLRILRAHEQSSPGTPLQWIWSGPGTQAGDLLQRLERELTGVTDFQFVRQRLPEAFLAMALAEESPHKDPIHFNFRTDSLAHPRRHETGERKVKSLSIFYLAAGIILIVVNLAWIGLLNWKDTQAQNALFTAAKRITGNPRIPRGQELYVAQRAVRDRVSSKGPFLRPFGPALTERLFFAIQAIDSHGATVESAWLSDTGFQISGIASEWTDPESLSADLKANGIENSIQSRELGPDEKIHFILEGGLPTNRE